MRSGCFGNYLERSQPDNRTEFRTVLFWSKVHTPPTKYSASVAAPGYDEFIAMVEHADTAAGLTGQALDQRSKEQ